MKKNLEIYTDKKGMICIKTKSGKRLYSLKEINDLIKKSDFDIEEFFLSKEI